MLLSIGRLLHASLCFCFNLLLQNICNAITGIKMHIFCDYSGHYSSLY